MALRTIVTLPEPVLYRKARLVKNLIRTCKFSLTI